MLVSVLPLSESPLLLRVANPVDGQRHSALAHLASADSFSDN